MAKTTLGELASLIRSKNAGPFWITFDVMFDTDADYQRAVDSAVINRAWVASTWHIEEEQILLVELAAARAIKFSFPRQQVQGDPGESDQYSGQQYAPLLDLLVG
ncbi:MAG: DUF4387 domain-containing protein [Granulosicoccaceae bacterium]